MSSIRVAIVGYGVIGKRVADAVQAQPDMSVSGVCDVSTDHRVALARLRGFGLFGPSPADVERMAAEGVRVMGTLDDLLAASDVVVDCTPKGVAAANKPLYEAMGVRAIFQGGEPHSLTGHSFVAQANYESALDRGSTRVVSCNTTATVRVLGALERCGLVRARGVLLRRATDPWESHLGGIMNTIVPERQIPSHQAEDARTVLPELDIVTMACKVSQTLSHVHYWWAELASPCSRDDVLDVLRAAPRVALIRAADGMGSINAVLEATRDAGRPRGDLWEVALWEDILHTQGREVFFCHQVDNQAIVVPETIDAIRALTGALTDGAASIQRTDAALGLGGLI